MILADLQPDTEGKAKQMKAHFVQVDISIEDEVKKHATALPLT